MGHKIIGPIRQKDHPLNRCWRTMRWRCYGNPRGKKTKHIRNYKDRGITICERWRKSFWDFVKDVGERPSPNHTIERINNNGDYNPENVKWATWGEQARNTRSSRFLTLNGETKTLIEWSETRKIDPRTLHARLRNRWPLELALNTPTQIKGVRVNAGPREQKRDAKTGKWCS